ncbi:MULTISPECIES: rhamnosyltransferase WsaF family glycosyltransferase [Bacillaceae]|uniref:rhamnosyltransferase WsaF family glycosyltransferase n=1 Tax=Bacillaceae TaxID=186817 RepID=UPI0029643F71|nr:hypothetical protein [Bacillus infantis]MDW2876420.1 hypothetical protein [Bacillus infantis]
MLSTIKRFAKKSSIMKRTYDSAKTHFINTSIGEITPFDPRKSTYSNRRINIIIPSINQEHMFGGIATALRFFNELAEEGNYTKRIILTDAIPDGKSISQFSDYELVDCMSDSSAEKQIVPFSDRYNKTIPIGSNDYFIATAWWTAYAAQRVVQWQSNMFSQSINKLIYFIQDYEPGFYSWSSQYVLCQSTYMYNGPQIAVFNTAILQSYFSDLGYRFSSTYAFEPQLHPQLKSRVDKSNKKKKKVLIYGRPSVSRNAFTLIIEALKRWVWIQDDIEEWEIVTAGENHSNIDLGNNAKVKSLGKLDIVSYAQLLNDSAIGISLMVSPHPSYPPLEMAHFGILVLTNSFENKNLTNWHDNIYSTSMLTPELISKDILYLCDKFNNDNNVGVKGKSRMDNFIESSVLFPFIPRIVGDLNKNT